MSFLSDFRFYGPNPAPEARGLTAIGLTDLEMPRWKRLRMPQGRRVRQNSRSPRLFISGTCPRSVSGMGMFVDFLKDEFSRRRQRNPGYSLRAFARSLKVNSSTLSAIVSQKRKATPTIAKRLLDQLGTDPFLKQKIITSMMGLELTSNIPRFHMLREDEFAAISEWEHFAILSLLETRNCRHSVSWISNRLNIGTRTVREALERLERLGLIRKSGGKWVTTGESIASPSDVPSAALRKHNQQYIEKALHSLERHPLEERDITGVTMAIDPAKLPEAKALVRAFRRQLCKFLESGDQTRVYRVNIQLFPIDER
jgi:hypothetical protein